ncbi:MAG: quinone-interacting membrane-bound oxidoreductase complex subunit QmoC [Archaeoglobaceae archaeon]
MIVDAKFAQEIIQAGGKSLKKCYQCATCSVVCPQSPDENPFPRKEMIWAQWGAKERLLSDADVWLCHQCNDCSDYCPRGAKPGEVLAAIRAKVVEHYTFPSFLSKIFRRPAGILLYFAIPIFFLALYMAIFNPQIPEGEIVLSKFIPHTHVELAGFAVGAWVLLVAAISAYRFWVAINSKVSKVYEYEIGEKGEIKITKASARFIEYLFWSIVDILKHSKFRQCNKAKYRFYAHLLIFWGFIVLGIATIGDIIYLYVLGHHELALAITDPVKIIGNFGALLLLIGTTWAIVARFKDERIGYGTYFDFLFLATILAVGVSGVLIEFFRYSESHLAYYAYMVHLILVFTLIAFAPYTKFAHLIYRSLSYVWAKSVGREVK